MKTTITSALAFLLFAGASTAALAQEHDHDRSQGQGQGGARPDHQGGPPGGAGQPRFQPGGQPGGPPRAGPPPAPAAAPAAQAQSPQGGHARFGAPPPPGGAAPAERGDRGFRGDRPSGERFGRDAGPPGERFRDHGPGDARQYDRGGPPSDDRRFGGGAGVPQGDRRFDRSGAPREVVPPRTAGGERGWDRDHDGHGPGRWDGRGDGRGGQPGWQRGDHWQRGRLPPVFWSQQRYHLRPYRAPYGYYVRDWGFGDILPRAWFGNDYWIDDFLDYDLPYPPPGYEWVRVGGDALLVDRYSGRIVQVVRGIFW
jgi:Ni/Co efflux regulator RcnB